MLQILINKQMPACSKKYYTLFSTQWITTGLLLCVMITSACHTEDNAPRAYEDLSAVVGPEGKTMTFFEDKRNTGKNIPISLYPTLIFQPLTFEKPSVIKLDAEKMSFNTLPAALIPISDNTSKWSVASSIPVANKPVEMIVPFEEPDTSLWLENYWHRFKLYRIRKEAETTLPANWERLDMATLDTLRRTLTAAIPDFEYGYSVVFEEIQRNDNIAITSKDLTQAGVATDYFSSTDLTTRGFHYRNGQSQYYYEGFWTDNFVIHFSFAGSKAGTYLGDQIQVTYQYKKNQQWLSASKAENTTITITKYGKIGELTEGSIEGGLTNNTGETIDFTMNFKLIRTR
jgi:hypothetical protein